MAGWKWFLIFLGDRLFGLVALMYLAQRSLMYFPDTVRIPPAQADLPQAEEVMLDTADGERVIVWHVAPRGDQPVVLYFHGNGGALRYRVDRLARSPGWHRACPAELSGYGGSSGRPSEDGLIEDARRPMRSRRSAIRRRRFLLWGESLGTGVAVALAAERPVGGGAGSAVPVGRLDRGRRLSFVPVRWLMKDQFRSDLRIGTSRRRC